MNSINASEAREKLYRLLDETASGHEPVLITGPRSSAVLIGEEDWRSIQESLYLLSVPGMRESIAEGSPRRLTNVGKNRAGDALADRLHKAGAEGRPSSRFAGLRPKTEQLLDVVADDPFRRPPPFEKLGL